MATPTNLPAAQTTGNVLTAAYVNDLRGAFRILQVVQSSTNTETTSSTSTFVTTGLTATITPQSSSSKILVLATVAGCGKDTGDTRLGLRLNRGATEICYFESVGGFTNTATTNFFGSCSTYVLDSPATTSATTYTVQFRSELNIARVLTQIGSARSTIVLLEVSA
jgi:hypothetical protein